MQLDADDDDQPFFRPAVVQTEPLLPKQREAQQSPGQGEPQANEMPGDHQEVATAAATATVEQEE